ncbi:hypothetical protein CKM354_000905100 [Cercospora kikuchii]|uniref:Uncharacterized protein n=2 Tax=Cercospora kikuchii TaxID=84275 RepID=A0A9P3FFU4_9PEZI|nr:uncharacterized protein CKM354_000905100 [Cercospora kikuchii]GIZ45903.1 hypothetical protein CKM354_000905100 [Cercospora kikuchii]
MRTWTIRRAQSIAWTKPLRWTTRLAVRRALHVATPSKLDEPLGGTSPQLLLEPLGRRYQLFRTIEPPGRDVALWLPLLEGALPPHLRDPNVTPPDITLGAVDVAQVLLAAQYPLNDSDKPIDLLYHLGIEQNRWTAVVWLIKKLIDRFPAEDAAESRLAGVGSIWQKVPSLDDCDQSLDLGAPDVMITEEALRSPPLDEMLDGLHPLNQDQNNLLGREVLGQVWRTLGAMVKACVGNDMRPEVLEIIAYLHHREVMPLAIYQAEPNPDRCAIQQPPLIPFLSSRILTSLSDAAWRAHEKLVIEEAKAYGALSSPRPEIRGSVFRVHVAGLRAEVWMELILWSCLHGGWTREGALILRSLLADRTKSWTLLSWTDYQKSLPENYSTEPRDWRSWEFLFKTRSKTSMDEVQSPKPSVARTISSEVVHAYVDALSCDVNIGVGTRGTDIQVVMNCLHTMRRSLMEQKQSLSFGTWAGISLRLLDTRSAAPETDSNLAQRVVALTSGFGSDLDTSNNQDLPAYVKDGTTAMQGILHRALYGQVSSGSFEGSLEVFNRIQYRADQDKFRAVGSFFGRLNQRGNVKKAANSVFRAVSSLGMFTSNLPTIEYPGFHTQIPITTLALLLDQVTEARAFEFGRWLIYSRDVDGPVIPRSSYDDPNLQPALIRFAAASNDKALLSLFKDSRLSRASLESVLISQIQALRWDAAQEALDYLSNTPGPGLASQPLAVAIRTMLGQITDVKGEQSDTSTNLSRAQSFVRTIARRQRKLRTDASVSLLAVLAAINKRWFDFAFPLCPKKSNYPLQLDTSKFNMLLEGVVAAHGSVAGRRLLGIFWPHSARRAHDAAFNMVRSSAMRKRMPRMRARALNSLKRQRIVISSPRPGDRSRLVLYGAIFPDVNTILVILRKALEEVKASPHPPSLDNQQLVAQAPVKDGAGEELDLSPRGIVAWAVRRLAELPYVQRNIVKQLDVFLKEQGMNDLRKDLPAIYEDVEAELLDNFADDEMHATPQQAEQHEQQAKHADSTLRDAS